MITDKNKILDYKIIKGSLNGNLYLDFIYNNKKILSNRYLLQDNLRIHHMRTIKDYCSKNNINLVYNPPYTPEFNPIEMVFSEIKNIFRKFVYHDNIESNIFESISKVNTNNLIKYYIKSYENIKKYQ